MRGARGVQSNSTQRSSIIQPIVARGNAARRALAAGKVWIRSPIALKRTISKRSMDEDDAVELLIPARISGAFYVNSGTNDVAGRMILGITNNFDAASVFQYRITLRNIFGGVIGSFRVNLGTNLADQSANVRFGKNQTASTSARAARISARSPAGIRGRSSPLRAHTESSSLTATTNLP